MLKNYEIVLLIHPNQGNHVESFIEKYCKIILENKGKIHRKENWNLRKLSFSIKKIRRAYYYLLNVECTIQILEKIKDLFRFNDFIIRHLILNRKKPISQPSYIMKNINNQRDK